VLCNLATCTRSETGVQEEKVIMKSFNAVIATNSVTPTGRSALVGLNWKAALLEDPSWRGHA